MVPIAKLHSSDHVGRGARKDDNVGAVFVEREAVALIHHKLAMLTQDLLGSQSLAEVRGELRECAR
jgi:hypothetical protein